MHRYIDTKKILIRILQKDYSKTKSPREYRGFFYTARNTISFIYWS